MLYLLRINFCIIGSDLIYIWGYGKSYKLQIPQYIMLPLGLIQQYMQKLDGWSLENEHIVKDKQFGTFKAAMDFINQTAKIAEKHTHYPDVIISNTRVRISLITKEEKSLTSKDFEIAQEIDKIGAEENKGILKGETTDSADLIRRIKEEVNKQDTDIAG